MIKHENDTGINILEQELKLVAPIKTSNLVLYDAANNLTRYDTVLDILTDFYNNRLQKYKDRKELYTKILINDINILKEKMRFIKDVINNVIIINKRKKDDIIKDLIKHGYKKMSSDINAIDDDIDTNEIEDNTRLKVNYKSYKYIFELGLFSVSKEKLDDLQKQIDDKQNEYNKYVKTPAQDLWKEELIELRNAYDKELIIWANNQKTEENNKKRKLSTNRKKK